MYTRKIGGELVMTDVVGWGEYEILWDGLIDSCLRETRFQSNYLSGSIRQTWMHITLPSLPLNLSSAAITAPQYHPS